MLMMILSTIQSSYGKLRRRQAVTDSLSTLALLYLRSRSQLLGMYPPFLYYVIKQ